MMHEVVLGYDIRTAIEADDPLWTPERRRQYLLRTDIRRPLSVDEVVWLRPDSSVRWGVGVTIETPKYASLAGARAAIRPAEVVIAITQWQGMGEPPVWVDAPADPTEIDPAWTRLGWDVCDGFFPSGLSNCGLGDEEREQLSEHARHLNEHGLFVDLPAAFAFRDFTNRRVSEHAPFVVLGLYTV
jgi:hypothetical protein